MLKYVAILLDGDKDDLAVVPEFDRCRTKGTTVPRDRLENDLAADPITPFGRAEPFEYAGEASLYYSIDAAKYASPKGAGYAVASAVALASFAIMSRQGGP